MNTGEMREYLKDKVKTVPRSNKDVEALYNEMNGIVTEIVQPETVAAEDNIYTYIGYGDTPPHMIKFMDIQVFTRGQPTPVTDPRVLAKIGLNRSFVKGEADMDEVFKQDELAAKRAQKQREEDQKLQIMVERQNRKG